MPNLCIQTCSDLENNIQVYFFSVVLPFIPEKQIKIPKFVRCAVFPLTLTCYILLAEEKSSSEEDSKNQSKSIKPMYLKDFERKELLEKGRFVGGVIVLPVI